MKNPRPTGLIKRVTFKSFLQQQDPRVVQKKNTLRPDGSHECHEAIYGDLLMADYSRDESFHSVCAIDTYRMRSGVTLSQFAFFLSKRSAIDLQDAQRRNPASKAPTTS